MPLTQDQQKKITAILDDYRKKADAIVAEHQTEVKKLLADLDAKKIQELHSAIGHVPGDAAPPTP